MLNAHEKKVLLRYCKWIVRYLEAFIERFHENLANYIPNLQEIFSTTHLTIHYRKFIQTLSIVIELSDRLEILAEATHYLGYIHHHYGLDKRHFLIAREAWIYTLKECFGASHMTHEISEAWRRIFDYLLDIPKTTQVP